MLGVTYFGITAKNRSNINQMCPVMCREKIHLAGYTIEKEKEMRSYSTWNVNEVDVKSYSTSDVNEVDIKSYETWNVIEVDMKWCSTWNDWLLWWKSCGLKLI